jgi:hypothetical protein
MEKKLTTGHPSAAVRHPVIDLAETRDTPLPLHGISPEGEKNSLFWRDLSYREKFL